MRIWIAGALLLAVAACSSAPAGGEEADRLFDRVAFLFEHYDAALAGADPGPLELAASNLKTLAAGNFDLLLAGLASQDPVRRGYAAFALGFSGNPRAVKPLVAATEHPDDDLRANAVAALGMLGLQEVPLDPFRKLMDDPSPGVRQAALYGLRPLVTFEDDRGMLDLVHGKLSDPDVNVRTEALIVLRKLRRKESIPVVVERSVPDREWLVRYNAALTLGAMGEGARSANPHLVEMLRDGVTRVVEGAWTALNRINGKDFDRSYATWRDWYDEERRHEYVCARHPRVVRKEPGVCPECKEALDRTPLPSEDVSKSAPAYYVCPDHSEVRTSTPSRCGREGCGKKLMPAAADAVLYVCPQHAEVQTISPSRCGQAGCGRELVPKKRE